MKLTSSYLFWKFFSGISLLLGFADEGPGIWTGTIEGKEGTFAFYLNEGHSTIVVFRGDDRGAAPERIRAKVRQTTEKETKEKLVELQLVAGVSRPWRYSASIPEGSKNVEELELEQSSSKGIWISLGKIRR